MAASRGVARFEAVTRVETMLAVTGGRWVAFDDSGARLVTPFTTSARRGPPCHCKPRRMWAAFTALRELRIVDSAFSRTPFAAKAHKRSSLAGKRCDGGMPMVSQKRSKVATPYPYFFAVEVARLPERAISTFSAAADGSLNGVGREV